MPNYTEKKTDSKYLPKNLHVSVSTKEQCRKACQLSGIKRLYVAGDLLLEQDESLLSLLKESSSSMEIWIKLPEVLREKDYSKVGKLCLVCAGFAAGMLISNLETYSYLMYHNYQGKSAFNHHIYVWNQEAIKFWEEQADSFCAPVECNYHEWKKLQNENFEYLCYGRIPMMVTANCIRKTSGNCRGKGVSHTDSITDRYQADFPVQVNCNYCYNVIYNSVPLSLHSHLKQIEELSGKGIRLDFTTESPQELAQITEEYIKFLSKKEIDFSFLKDYTTGHYKKGAL